MSHVTQFLPDPDAHPAFFANVPAKRLAAFVLDALVIFGFCLLALPFTAFLGLFFFPVLWMVVSFVYRVATIAGGSATWGMRLMGIEFRTFQGELFDLPTAFLHTLGFAISVAFAPLQLISVVLMLTTARGQGLTDHAIGSVAMNRRL